MTDLQALTVTYTGGTILFNRAVGMLRRRQYRVVSLRVGPGPAAGTETLTAMLETDRDAAARLVTLFEKVHGVAAVRTHPVAQGIARELALVTLRPGAEAMAELLDTLDLYHAEIVEEDGDTVVAQVTGEGSFILSCVRALDRFGVIDFARSGAVAVARAH